MTLTAFDIALYAGGLFVLFLTPGPVWLAMIARTMTGGFHAGWPLAVGVAVGDVLWPLAAVLGMSWVIASYGGVMVVLKFVAAAIFAIMGVSLLRAPDAVINAESRLNRPGIWAGFAAGLAVIIGNPKAILFYMGVLPGFFDLSKATAADIVVICAASAIVPLVGNLILSLFVERARRLVSAPDALKRMNVAAGWLFLVVAVAILIT